MGVQDRWTRIGQDDECWIDGSMDTEWMGG